MPAWSNDELAHKANSIVNPTGSSDEEKCPPSQVKAAASVLCTLAMIMTAGRMILFCAVTGAMNYERNIILQKKMPAAPLWQELRNSRYPGQGNEATGRKPNGQWPFIDQVVWQTINKKDPTNEQ